MSGVVGTVTWNITIYHRSESTWIITIMCDNTHMATNKLVAVVPYQCDGVVRKGAGGDAAGGTLACAGAQVEGNSDIAV